MTITGQAFWRCVLSSFINEYTTLLMIFSYCSFTVAVWIANDWATYDANLSIFQEPFASTFSPSSVFTITSRSCNLLFRPDQNSTRLGMILSPPQYGGTGIFLSLDSSCTSNFSLNCWTRSSNSLRSAMTDDCGLAHAPIRLPIGRVSK